MNYFVLKPYGGMRFGYRYSYGETLDPFVVGDPKMNGVCSRCGQGLGSLPWLAPRRMKLSKAKFPDFLWGAGFSVLMSDRLVSVIRDNLLKGARVDDSPIEIVKVGRKKLADVEIKPPRYHYAWIQHAGADVDDKRSGARRPIGLCPICREGTEAIESVVFREGTWKGDDIFHALGLAGTIIVTERFKELAMQNSLLGADFVPAEAFRFDFTRNPYRY